MATATRNLEQEFDTLREDIDRLRKDIGSLTETLGGAAADELRSVGRRGRAAAQRAGKQAADAADEAAEEIGKRARDGLAALEGGIEERPLTSVLLAFSLGVLLGKLVGR